MRPETVLSSGGGGGVPAEEARLEALRRYGILDTPDEPAFARVAELTRDLFEVPVALVSLLDSDRQWVKAGVGLDRHEWPRAHAVCDHTIRLEGPGRVLVVPDLTADPRFRDSPLVAGPPHLRFYAGTPLVAPGGERVGTVSVLDFAPRPQGLPPAGPRWLASLAAIAVDEMELRLRRREAEAALAAEARLRRAQESAGIVAFEFGPGGASEAEPALRALYGIAPDVPIDFDTVLAVVHPADRAALAEARERLTREGGTFDHRYRVVLPGGEVRWLQARGAVLDPRRGPAGPARRMTGVVQDITAGQQAEEARLLLAREVDHRAKNALAVVQAALHLTPKDDPQAYAAAIEGRIAALARAHAVLAEGRWAWADLRTIIEGELRAFHRRPGQPPLLQGGPVSLAPHAVQPMAMTIHELATNATKHGALREAEGRLHVSWGFEGGGETLVLRWVERGGPPVLAPPTRRGFGTRLLEATIRGQLGGTIAFDWKPEGLSCEIRIPAARLRRRE
ncbi:HWE histidine kinase domain-containing protein [Falsiroseomonas sp. CW058]|uniref:HWE histidine kinase domain-containing protein n=1 Tax=Falsiroseomonas sp. CW058 TaxID=3388664 RepID=UPI003D3170F5